MPKTWKDIILKDKRNAKSSVIVRNSQIHSLNKFTSKELYLILVETNIAKPATQNYFDNLFETSQFNWKKIYLLIRNTTFDTKARMFQYNVLHNIFYANNMLLKFGKGSSPRWSFCKLHVKIIMESTEIYTIK